MEPRSKWSVCTGRQRFPVSGSSKSQGSFCVINLHPSQGEINTSDLKAAPHACQRIPVLRTVVIQLERLSKYKGHPPLLQAFLHANSKEVEMAEERDSKAQLSFRGHVHKFSVETKAVPMGLTGDLSGNLSCDFWRGFSFRTHFPEMFLWYSPKRSIMFWL